MAEIIPFPTEVWTVDPDTQTPIRKFVDSDINAAIDKALAQVPRDQNGAVIAFANKTDIRLAVVGKVGEHWSAVGVLDRPWNGQLDGEAAVRFSW